MGNDLFGIDVAKIVGDSFKGQLLSATLKQYTVGTPTPGQLTGGTNPTETVYTGIDGFVDEYNESQIDGSSVKQGDRKVVLIGESLPAGVIPSEGDRIDIESFTDLLVVAVKRDPAAATYSCQVRG